MFERFTETARKVIFFARHQASVLGNSYIDTEHLLLGLMSADQELRARLQQTGGTADEFTRDIQPEVLEREKISTSVDLPLSQNSRRVMVCAAKECDALGHNQLDCGHLVLGLLLMEGCPARTFLEKHGVAYAGYREIVRTLVRMKPVSVRHGGSVHEPRPAERASEWEASERLPPAAPSLAVAITILEQSVATALAHLHIYSEDYGERRLKRRPWSRKEAMGHLVNLAIVHHHWAARVLTEPRLTAAGYPAEEWVSAQHYATYPWRELVDLWIAMNRLLLHVLSAVPEEKVGAVCRIGIEEPRTLLSLINRYAAECEDLMGQILARL